MSKKMLALGSDIFGAVAAVLLIIACFVPYAKALGVTVKLFRSNGQFKDGVFFVALAAIALITCIFVYGKKSAIVYLVASILSFVLMLYEVHDLADATSGLGLWGNIIEKGAGYYLLIVSAIFMVIAGILRVVFSAVNKNSESFY